MLMPRQGALLELGWGQPVDVTAALDHGTHAPRPQRAPHASPHASSGLTVPLAQTELRVCSVLTLPAAAPPWEAPDGLGLEPLATGSEGPAREVRGPWPGLLRCTTSTGSPSAGLY